MKTERWNSGTIGRSHTVARGELVWSVSNATTRGAAFDIQVEESLAFLESSLLKAGSSKYQLLSVQVLLSDIAHREQFNERWCSLGRRGNRKLATAVSPSGSVGPRSLHRACRHSLSRV